MGIPAHSMQKQPVAIVIWSVALVVLLALSFLAVGSAAGDTGPTFSKQVAPILFKNCVKCHREGDLASRVPLVTFDSVRPWAESIKQQVMTREMPPWPADPSRSAKFRNDPRLSQQDIDTLVAWVNAGAPKGNDADLPPLPKFMEDGWMHPQGLKPDLVLSLPGEVHVPATGEIPYVRLLVKVPFEGDRWIVASQTRPSNPHLVHHMAITELALADGMTPADLDQLALVARQMGLPNLMTGAQPAVTAPSNPEVFDMLGMFTPGTTFEMYPEGSARLLKGGKNMYLNFNMHYMTTGKPETDRSMIAFWFQPGPPRHQLYRIPGAGETLLANGKELLTDTPGTKAEGTQVAIPPIPPHAENYELTGVTGYPRPVTIYQFQPHAHRHGKDFTYTVVYPDGREQTVLSVPKFDTRWQMAYEFETPLKLPAGSKLVVTAHYANSQTSMSQMNMSGMSMPGMNMGPPSSEREVFFRDQNLGSDEMFSPFVLFTMDDEDPANPAHAHESGENANNSHPWEQAKGSALEIGEVVGCLEPGPQLNWLLIDGSDPIASETQSTTSAALKEAEAIPSGGRRYQLLGAGFFNPLSHRGEKVAVKGILITDNKESRINVTSLQMVAANCAK